MASASASWEQALDRALREYPERGYRAHAARLRVAGYAITDYDARLYLAVNNLSTPDERRAYAESQPPSPLDTPDEAEARVATAEALTREGRAKRTLRLTRADNRALLATAVERDAFLDEMRALVRQFPTLDEVTPPLPDTRTHQPKTLCLCLSDLHIGATVSLEDAHGLGEYDLDIFRRRVDRLLDAIVKITADERANSRIDNLLIFFIGDAIEGVLMHKDQQHNATWLTDQLSVGTEVLARQLFRPLATLFPRVHVETCLGNHGRIGENHGDRPFGDSYDRIFYLWLQSRLEAIKNLTWSKIHDYEVLIQLHGWTFRATHGQQQKGSPRVPLVPARNGARDYVATHHRVIDASISGHLHSIAYGLDNSTQLICNGSMPGVSEYGLKHGFSEIPMQMLFAVNDIAPVQALYPIYLEDRRAYSSAAPRDVFATAQAG